MVYIARGISELFLSKSACLELGLVSPDFPTVGEFAGGGRGTQHHVGGLRSPPPKPEATKDSKKVRFSTSPPLTYPRVGNLGEPSATTGESDDESLIAASL